MRAWLPEGYSKEDPVKFRRTVFVGIVTAVFAFGVACSGGPSEAPEAETAEAASEPQRLSPHESVSGMVGEANITVTYGRPYKKEREIYGGLVPFDTVWRTGADEATTLETDRDLMLGSLHVPAGKYSLYTIPSAEKWTLIVNNTWDQWGTNYDEAQDLGRVDMEVSTSEEATEQLTIGIEAGEGSNGTLSIVWDTTTATLPIMAH